jgi:hypothetical protein
MKAIRTNLSGTIIIGMILLSNLNNTFAQNHVGTDRSYHLLNQNTPPGVASIWAGGTGKTIPGHFQQVKFILPSDGSVSLFHNNGASTESHPAPFQVGIAVGYVYRFRISQMKEYPNVELYPTVEFIDHTHPPQGEEGKFPVPVEITKEEIDLALKGSMITKIVYLEEPRTANVFPVLDGGRRDIKTIPMHKNLMREADKLGRPMAIIRIGGRQPDRFSNDIAFFAGNGPIRLSDRKID